MLGDIVKIIYFDEGSATDYCQIRSGGNVNTEAIASDSKAKGADGTVGASIGAKLTSLIPFINPTATVTAEGSAEASYHIETVVKSIVTNTVLTDFLSNVNDDDGRNVTLFEGKRIEQVPGSISSLSLLTPYFGMLRSRQGIPAGDLEISIDKLDSTLSKAKGYLEFIGKEKGKSDVIIRFNSAAFKNNYRPSDLLRMNLKLYATLVGECRLSDLTPDNEFKLEGFSVGKDNPDYQPNAESASTQMEPLLKVYDVILAGVKTDG